MQMQRRCRLSKRQRTLYEDYMASSDTSATLASSNFLGIINVLMQLRKVHLVDLGLHYQLLGDTKMLPSLEKCPDYNAQMKAKLPGTNIRCYRFSEIP